MATGKVLDWDEGTGKGLILGEDKRRYPFVVQEWKGKRPPRAGDTVDFEETEEQATGIYVTQGATASLADVTDGLKDGALRANEAMKAMAQSPQAEQVRRASSSLPPWARDFLALPVAFYGLLGLLAIFLLPYLVMGFLGAQVRFGFFDTAFAFVARLFGDDRWVQLVGGMSSRSAGDGLIFYILLQIPSALVPLGLGWLIWRALRGSAGTRFVRRVSIASLFFVVLPPVLMARYISRDYSTAFALVAGDFRVGLGWLVLVVSLGAVLASTYRHVPTPLNSKPDAASLGSDGKQ